MVNIKITFPKRFTTELQTFYRSIAEIRVAITMFRVKSAVKVSFTNFSDYSFQITKMGAFPVVERSAKAGFIKWIWVV